jgi:hypothetical protein
MAAMRANPDGLEWLICGREDRILWIDNAFPRLLTVSVADPKG